MDPTSESFYKPTLAIHHRITSLYARISDGRVPFRGLREIGRDVPKAAGSKVMVDTDRVLCALAIKAATTKEAVWLLCEAGNGDGAISLTRVLIENALLMQWQRLGVSSERLETYILFTSVSHERTAKTLDRYREFLADSDPTPLRSDPYHKAIADEVFEGHADTWAWFPDPITGKLKRVSVAQMFREVNAGAPQVDYEMVYHLASESIHSAPYSLSRLLKRLQVVDTFVLQAMPDDTLCVVALALSNAAMLRVLGVLNDALKLDLSAELQSIAVASQVIPDAR